MPIRYRTADGVPITAANYADACAIAKHYGLSRVDKSTAEEVPAYNENIGANPKRYQHVTAYYERS